MTRHTRLKWIFVDQVDPGESCLQHVLRLKVGRRYGLIQHCRILIFGAPGGD